MSYEMNSGLVIAGAYADKVRRTLFAQKRNIAVSDEEIARAAAELNVILYEIFVNKIGLDKGDAVRVRIKYEVNNGRIEWNYETLRVEAFKRVDDQTIQKITREVTSQAHEIIRERFGRPTL